MNKYLACFTFVALCFCLSEGATRNEVERLIHQASQQVRTQEIFAIKTATSNTLGRATTQQQKVCVTTKVGPANRDLNLALQKALADVENQYRALTAEQLAQVDLISLGQEVHQTFASAASAAHGWVDQINSCA